MNSNPSIIQHVSKSLLNELRVALALPQSALIEGIIHVLFGRATLRFSHLAYNLDCEVQAHGVMQGARWLLRQFVAGFEAQGAEKIPNNGPLIIASNHPASYDGLLISAFVKRPDYKIIIGDIPFFDYLPNIRQYAIFSPNIKNTFGRMQTVRTAIRHLKEGGALLIFPRGGIEPDPAFMPQPDAEFHKWSRSLEIFLKSVPETKVLVTAVSGVISQKIFNHPFTRLRKLRTDRQRLAFMYQMVLQALREKELFGLHPRVTFGELLGSGTQSLENIETAARRTLEKHIAFIQNITGVHHALKK